MNIDEVYKFMSFISNKSQSGNLTPKDFNSILPRAFSEWVMKRYHNVKAQLPNGEALISWQQNQKISDDLKFLLTKLGSVVVSPDGTVDLPADYLHLSSLRYRYTYLDNGTLKVLEDDVDVVRDSEIGGMLGSYIFKKHIDAKKKVIAAIYSTYIQFYPNDIQTAIVTYLRKPIDPVWAFTVVNGRPVYDPANSVDLEAPDEAANEIMMMALSYLGINLREQELIQYSEMLKNQGV